MIEDLMKMRKLYELKRVYRHNSVGERKESSAEHSWSCLMLADYFISQMKLKLDRVRVYELLMYHDVVEIEAGDIDISDTEKRKNKLEDEERAYVVLVAQLPDALKERFNSRFHEFEECRTEEARFAKAIDRLDAIMHELDYPQDWKGWSDRMLRELHGKHINDFPKLKEIFEELAAYVLKHDYYNN